MAVSPACLAACIVLLSSCCGLFTAMGLQGGIKGVPLLSSSSAAAAAAAAAVAADGSISPEEIAARLSAAEQQIKRAMGIEEGRRAAGNGGRVQATGAAECRDGSTAGGTEGGDKGIERRTGDGSSSSTVVWGACKIAGLGESGVEADAAGGKGESTSATSAAGMGGSFCSSQFQPPLFVRPDVLPELAQLLGLDSTHGERLLSYAIFPPPNPHSAASLAPAGNCSDFRSLLINTSRGIFGLLQPIRVAPSNPNSMITVVLATHGLSSMLPSFLRSLADVIHSFNENCLRIVLVEFSTATFIRGGTDPAAAAGPAGSPSSDCLLLDFSLRHGIETRLLKLHFPGGTFSRSVGLHIGCPGGIFSVDSDPIESVKMTAPEAALQLQSICFFPQESILFLNPNPLSKTMSVVTKVATRGWQRQLQNASEGSPWVAAGQQLLAEAQQAAANQTKTAGVMLATGGRAVRNIFSLIRQHVAPLRSFLSPITFGFRPNVPRSVMPGLTGEWRNFSYANVAVSLADFLRVGGHPNALLGLEDDDNEVALKFSLCSQPFDLDSNLAKFSAEQPTPRFRAQTDWNGLEMKQEQMVEMTQPLGVPVTFFKEEERPEEDKGEKRKKKRTKTKADNAGDSA